MNKIVLEEIKSNCVEFKDNGRYLIEEYKNKKFIVKKGKNIIIDIFNENDIDSNYIFDIEENSSVVLNIFDASKNINRDVSININGENSNIILSISAISLNENNYNINVYHNNKNTSSKTNIHALALDNNKIFIKNNGYIKKGSQKSKLNQDNKIIIMNDNNSKIEPNLFIDEYDVEASHGAYIGKFDEEELFYLNSRGLNDKESYNILINGFLIGEFNIEENIMEKLKDIIYKYVK